MRIANSSKKLNSLYQYQKLPIWLKRSMMFANLD